LKEVKALEKNDKNDGGSKSNKSSSKEIVVVCCPNCNRSYRGIGDRWVSAPYGYCDFIRDSIHYTLQEEKCEECEEKEGKDTANFAVIVSF
jgi:hypothetical protein